MDTMKRIKVLIIRFIDDSVLTRQGRNLLIIKHVDGIDITVDKDYFFVWLNQIKEIEVR